MYIWEEKLLDAHAQIDSEIESEFVSQRVSET